MSLQPYALVSLADLKDALGKGGTGKDDVFERAINSASRIIEADLGRRLRYRAPEAVDGAADIVASVTLATSGSLTIAAQPDSAGRTLIVTITDTDRSVRSGTLTATGTVNGTAGVTETFDFSNGLRLHGRKFFTALSSLTLANVAAPSSADTIKVGSSLGMVEYHSVGDGCSRIKLLETPVYQIADIYEDANRNYAAASLLDFDDDYEYGANGYVTRVSAATPWGWWSGYRAIKVRYSAGYGGLSTVPPHLKDICIRLAASKKQEFERGALNVSSVSDDLGNFTRFGEARLTAAMRDDLAEFRVGEIFTNTAERDFDLEAV